MNSIFSKARKEKDKSFDGVFFFGVKTTGIFCRPSCPAPVAKEENVVYFKTIFQAMAQGFRPCQRCRPDIEIDHYNGNIKGTLLVKKALSLIFEGYLNYHSLEELAAKLNISDRYLRKIFLDNLTVSPVKIAKFHKALFAKKLLLFSNQSITQVALASGFGSLRQFNEVFKQVFKKTPTMLRKEKAQEFKTDTIPTFLLPYNKPFIFSQILGFMRDRAIQGVEAITDKSYTRSFRLEQTKGYLIVTDLPEESVLKLQISCDDIKCYMQIINKIRKVFDLDRDFTKVNKAFARDELLAKGMEKGHVPRLPVAFNVYEFVVRAILGQQISVKAATTLARRIAEKAGLVCDATFPDGLNYFFPNPKELMQTDLDNMGITKTRQATIKRVTQSLIDKKISLNSNQDFDEFYKTFSSLKGIGDWTVNYVAMRGLGMQDSFPASDLGVIRALAKNNEKPTKSQIIKIAEKWRPYRAYAALCLWNQA